PTVVAPGQDNVDLVTAERAVLVLPQRTGPGMKRQALGAAVAEGKYLRLVLGFSDERVVFRDRAVVAQPQHLTAVIVAVLRPLLLLPLADGQVQQTVRGESDASPEVGDGR